MGTEKVVIYEVDGGVARITLNRPEKKNALNEDLIAGVKELLSAAEADEQVRVVMIAGAGSDFCSGADLSALQKIAEGSVSQNQDDARSLMDLFLLIRSVAVPVVAAVRGRALAGGCGLATACDLVVAAESARFGYPEVKIGFVPAMVAAILRRNVPEKRAFELLTRGGELSAIEAREIGLVNRIFPEDNFAVEAQSYVADFTKMSRSAVALTKQLLYQMDGMGFAAALEAGVDVNVIARLTSDCQKGVAKFLKR